MRFYQSESEITYSPYIGEKPRQSAEIALKTEQFIKAGKSITQIPYGDVAQLEYSEWTKGVMKDVNH